ncbi:MAG: BlaI/MecI/CopY family transcriptional regulator [Firmicutes bacterium]|nr:BlaI/MecI/CopY family transcriptional regulator [Bacillota bacterium]
MESGKLFDAEYRFMNLDWQHEPINSTDLVKLCREEVGWKKSTTYSMLKRLSKRGIVKNKNAVVSALTRRKQVQKYESEAVLEKAFDGSLPSFIAVLNMSISASFVALAVMLIQLLLTDAAVIVMRLYHWNRKKGWQER